MGGAIPGDSLCNVHGLCASTGESSLFPIGKESDCAGIFPGIVPAEIREQRKALRYHGTKEEIYLADFVPAES